MFTDGDPSNDQVDVRYNDNGVPGNLAGQDRAVWVASQTSWNDVVSSSFVFHDLGSTGKCPSLVQECKGRQQFDGNNDVGWIDIKDPQVLGVTWFGTVSDEFDMALYNKNFSWYIGDSGSIPGGSFDTQTVWQHEFGHALGLDHSAVEGSVMEPFYEGVRRVLTQDDKDGVSYLYPAGEVSGTPVVDISLPADGAQYASGASISFAGSASDLEDGDLSASISWVSSIDGSIGSGASINEALSDGVHTVTASATDSTSNTGSNSIQVVVGTLPPLVVSVSADEQSYRNRENAYMTAHVASDGNPVNGSVVSIVVTTADGGTLTCSPSTNESGDATCRYKVNSKRDGTGTYNIVATATKSGYASGSGTGNFIVN